MSSYLANIVLVCFFIFQNVIVCSVIALFPLCVEGAATEQAVRRWILVFLWRLHGSKYPGKHTGGYKFIYSYLV